MISPSEKEIKNQIIKFSQRLYQKGFVANHDGNITVKHGIHYWATPTAQSKGDITEEMLVSLDYTGEKIAGSHQVFSEINLHLACYQIREDIEAVIHAHPPKATALACTNTPLQKIFIAEAVVTLGDEIPLVPFMPPNCPNTKNNLRPFLEKADVVMLQNHGLIAVGKNLEQAYYRLELAEHLATIQWHAASIGQITPLPRETVQYLLDKIQKSALQPSWPSDTALHNAQLKKIIQEEINLYLAGC